MNTVHEVLKARILKWFAIPFSKQLVTSLLRRPKGLNMRLNLWFWHQPCSNRVNWLLTVNPKGIQPWIFTGRTDAEAPILWPPGAKSWLVGKDPDAGKDWRQDKRVAEGEIVGWDHWLGGRESEWTPGDGDGQGGLVCCDSWCRKESDTTEQLKWTELNWTEE